MVTKFSSPRDPEPAEPVQLPDVITDEEMLVVLTKICRNDLNKPTDRMAAYNFILKLQGRETSGVPVTVIDDIPFDVS